MDADFEPSLFWNIHPVSSAVKASLGSMCDRPSCFSAWLCRTLLAYSDEQKKNGIVLA